MSIFSQASALIKSYTDAGYVVNSEYQWTGVEATATNANDNYLNGGFAIATKDD